MNKNRYRFWSYIWIWVLNLCLVVTSCSNPPKVIKYTPFSEPVLSKNATDHKNNPTIPLPVTSTRLFPTPRTGSPIYTIQPSLTVTELPTLTPVSTDTPSPTPTATWIYNKAGMIVAPILLYHHISDTATINRYFVTTNNFRSQMLALKEWGYTSITPAYFRRVLVDGGDLPTRPVLITFDDGDLDVYKNAYPIMREYGFIGAFYIVSSRMGADGYVGIDQLKEMIAAGWEIGSHTIDHIDLTANHDQARYEMLQSRLDLEDTLSVTVTSIAYPYGLVDAFIATKAQDYGYVTGMGLGILTEHTWSSMYYLNRREVHGDMDLTSFSNLLPWSGPVETPTLMPETLIPPR